MKDIQSSDQAGDEEIKYELNSEDVQYPVLFGRRGWTVQMDRKLICLVEKYGRNWKCIQGQMGRSGKSCRDRWVHFLDPRLNFDKFSFYEYWLLYLSVEIVGKKWAKICKYFDNRSDKYIKNKWSRNTTVKKLPEFNYKLNKIIKKGLQETILEIMQEEQLK